MHAELPPDYEEKKKLIAEQVPRILAKVIPQIKKIFDEQDEKNIEFLPEIRRVANPNGRDLTLVYPHSGRDVKTPLRAIGATTLILIDKGAHGEGIKEEIKRTGGTITETSSSPGRTEINFEWEGKTRKLVFYQIEIRREELEKLPMEMNGGYDIYFEKRSWIDDNRIKERFLTGLRVGGFHISDDEIGSNLGFRNLPLMDKFESYLFDEVRLYVYEKTQSRPAIENLLLFNGIFHNADSLKYGGHSGIGERWEESLKAYRDELVKLKNAFDSLPQELKDELKPKIIDTLYNASGDMSRVWYSPEFWEREFYKDHHARGRVPSQKERLYYMSKIDDAKHSTDRPTEQQLEKFMEEGRKTFREVWGSEFVQ